MPTAREPIGGGDFKLMPQGTFEGRCSGIWDLGTQYNLTFDISKPQVLIQFEIPEHRIEIEGQDLPMVISQIYTLSLHKKANLRTMLQSWRDRAFNEEELEGFNLKKCLGVHARVQVFHNPNSKGDRTYANINSVGPPINKTQDCTIEPVYYDLDDHGLNIPKGTPEWIEKIIKSSDEYREMSGEGPNPSGNYTGYDNPGEPAEDDDIPF